MLIYLFLFFSREYIEFMLVSISLLSQYHLSNKSFCIIASVFEDKTLQQATAGVSNLFSSKCYIDKIN